MRVQTAACSGCKEEKDHDSSPQLLDGDSSELSKPSSITKALARMADCYPVTWSCALSIMVVSISASQILGNGSQSMSIPLHLCSCCRTLYRQPSAPCMQSTHAHQGTVGETVYPMLVFPDFFRPKVAQSTLVSSTMLDAQSSGWTAHLSFGGPGVLMLLSHTRATIHCMWSLGLC